MLLCFISFGVARLVVQIPSEINLKHNLTFLLSDPLHPHTPTPQKKKKLLRT